MNIMLWLVQILASIAFLVAGLLKTFAPIADLAEQMPWAADLPLILVRFIGIVEILGAVGLLLPAATRVLPGLTPLAATGLGTIVVLAAIFHIARGEFSDIISNLILLALAVFIAFGRWKLRPVDPRS